MKLAIAITLWTLLAWGGRIRLLTADEGIDDWVRIVGSILIGLFAAATLAVDQLEPARRPALIVFAVWSAVIWLRSLIVNWMGSGTLPFKLVHTVLALGFFVLAGWAIATASGDDAVPGTAQAHGQHRGEGEAPRLPGL